MAAHVFTSCSFSYINRARVLARTLKRFHPDWQIWLVMVDKVPPGLDFDLNNEDFDHFLDLDDLYGEDHAGWIFGLDIVEACTAVKGRASQVIMSEDDCSELIYLDPDIALFNNIHPVVKFLEEYSIILTPHQVDPEPRNSRLAIQDNEIASLQYGVFNFGFFAVKNDLEGKRFIQWWDERLHDWCHDRLDVGLFVDQKWANLVPCFFDGVKVLRDPGYNVASWNVSGRKMKFDENGTALINGNPLRFYHFTKLGPVGDGMTQRYARDNTEIYELWWWYREEVKKMTSDAVPKGWWKYNCFEDGIKIPKIIRELYRSRRDLQDAFSNPFLTGTGSFYEWLLAEGYSLGEISGPGFQPV
ncbi:hypothetical protein C8J38_1342 [Rhizobium sp. PP-WC-2G-219]|nr:hypothetical protein C8J38_1342 [Rhizobium sp. PP-WC-2G-219]